MTPLTDLTATSVEFLVDPKQKALGRRYRKCPDGIHHWISDEEYNERYKEA